MLPKYTLAPINHPEVGADEPVDNSTVALVEFGLRDGGTLAEYHLANRLQRLREIALQLVNDLVEDGQAQTIPDDFLYSIDVEIEALVRKRLIKE
jgi:hypothetical protein